MCVCVLLLYIAGVCVCVCTATVYCVCVCVCVQLCVDDDHIVISSCVFSNFTSLYVCAECLQNPKKRTKQ